MAGRDFMSARECGQIGDEEKIEKELNHAGLLPNMERFEVITEAF
jgi:hypothetical protein